MGSTAYEYDDVEPRDEIDSIIPAPVGMRAVVGAGKKAEEWPVACLALTATSEVRAILIDDSDGMSNFADELGNFSGFLYAGETLEDHVKGKAEVLAEDKAEEERAKMKANKAKAKAKAVVKPLDATAVFNKLTTKAKAKR